MKKQAKLWLEIDKRCDLKIADLTMRSILTKETEDEQIQKLMISKEARENILRTLLATLVRSWSTSTYPVDVIFTANFYLAANILCLSFIMCFLTFFLKTNECIYRFLPPPKKK